MLLHARNVAIGALFNPYILLTYHMHSIHIYLVWSCRLLISSNLNGNYSIFFSEEHK